MPLHRAFLPPTLSLAVLCSLPGCASTPGEADLRGLPEVRTVTVGSVRGGAEAAGGTIRYEEQPVLVQETVEGGVDEVYAALLESYRSEGLVPDGLDAASGIVSVGRVEWSGERAGRSLSAFLDCGTGTTGRPIADAARVVAALAAQVRDAGGGFAGVTLRLGASAYPFDNLAGMLTACVTTGELERSILRRVRTALAPPAGGEAPAVPAAVPPSVPPSLSAAALVRGLEPGASVRLWLGPDERMGGTYLGVQGTDLVLGTGRRTPVPLARIQGIEVRRTNRSAMLLGVLAGVAAGVTVATTTDLGIVGRHEVQGQILNPGLGALAGGLAGALVASLTFGTDWVRLELPGGAAPR